MRKKLLASVWEGLAKHIGPRTPPQEAMEAYGASVPLDDARFIKQFESNPNNVFLVSFPRTGSHWLRMLMELYFERPLLTRSFYYPNERNILALHTHDVDLNVRRQSVIYLYRNPVDTVYSQLRYNNESVSDIPAAIRWADLYGKHLYKWLVNDDFTRRKTIISYEGLRGNLVAQFDLICKHFNKPLDAGRLRQVAGIVDHEAVARKTPHDPRVVSLDSQYGLCRDVFRREMGDEIMSAISAGRPELSNWLAPPTSGK